LFGTCARTRRSSSKLRAAENKLMTLERAQRRGPRNGIFEEVAGDYLYLPRARAVCQTLPGDRGGIRQIEHCFLKIWPLP
jgi:hypothetical protein